MSPITARSNDSVDLNPRPTKRQRTTPCDVQDAGLIPLPPPALLLTLPALAAHPPTHALHPQSLLLSYQTFKRCLEIKTLSPDIECRAWAGLAEVGMNAISGRFNESKEHPWAVGIEQVVGKALSKGLLLAQRHPFLRIYRLHLQLLQAHYALWQGNHKYARNTLRRLLSSSLPTDPPAYIYTAHLALVYHFLMTPKPSSSSPTPSPSATDIGSAFDTLKALQKLAQGNGDGPVVLLALIVRLGIVVSRGIWTEAPSALQAAEQALGLSYHITASKSKAISRISSDASSRKDMATKAASPGDSLGAAAKMDIGRTSSTASSRSEAAYESVDCATSNVSAEDISTAPKPATFATFENPFEVLAATHTIIMGILFHTHMGDSARSSPRLQHLHALLDTGATDKFSDGIGRIPLSRGPPLEFWTTHPRVLFALGFLVSAVSKRDAVGRQPKRRTFSSAGLEVLQSGEGPALDPPAWSGAGDLDEAGYRLLRIQADLLSELAGISIMCRNHGEAEDALNKLIALTRSYDLFSRYAPRITLHHAHLAHSLGLHERALQCYDVAAHAAEQGGAGLEGEFIAAAAHAGGTLLRIGLSEGELTGELVAKAHDAAETCRGMGGTLEAIGAILESFLAPEILKSKQHLKHALELTTQAQDNHSRALILALLSSNYMHTAPSHAFEMLSLADQLGAGIGAPSDKNASGHVAGNAPLRLWVGERRLELYRRAEKSSRAERQIKTNALFRNAVEEQARRFTLTA